MLTFWWIYFTLHCVTLQKCQMCQFCVITEKHECMNISLFAEFTKLQRKLKQSLHRTWKNALRHDWIPEEVAKSLPVLEFYTGVRWTKMVKALKNYKKKMTSIYDIFNVINSRQRTWTDRTYLLKVSKIQGRNMKKRINFSKQFKTVLLTLLTLRYSAKQTNSIFFEDILLTFLLVWRWCDN